MNIEKSSDGKTSIKIAKYQILTYDPSNDSYELVIFQHVGPPHKIVIGSDILDALYNRCWEE
jgi:hypothetical protein